MIRKERASLVERETYRQLFGDPKDLEDADFNLEVGDVPCQALAAGDVIKLYPGTLPSTDTPMARFMAMSPTHDAHPWLAKSAMEQSRIKIGDLESLDIRRFASELVRADCDAEIAQEGRIGSPLPSSETLSASLLREIRSKRKAKAGARAGGAAGARVRRRIAMKRARKEGDIKVPRSAAGDKRSG